VLHALKFLAHSPGRGEAEPQLQAPWQAPSINFEAEFAPVPPAAHAAACRPV
jgi:hypothetical protein